MKNKLRYPVFKKFEDMKKEKNNLSKNQRIKQFIMGLPPGEREAGKVYIKTLREIMAKSALSSKEQDDFIEEHKNLFYKTIAKNVDTDTNGPDAFNADIEVPTLIEPEQLRKYFVKILNEYSNFSRGSIENKYKLEPKNWKGSTSTRARMVLIEATDDNLTGLGKAILNASPTERVVVIGLSEDKQTMLKDQLVAAWNNRLADDLQKYPEGYRDKVLSMLSKNDQPLTKIEDADLASLMGPHSFATTADISSENLNKQVGNSCLANIEEVLLYGVDDKLADNLAKLASAANCKQFLAIRSKPFELPTQQASSTAWTTAFLGNVNNKLERITDGRNPENILNDGGHLKKIKESNFTKAINIVNLFVPGWIKIPVKYALSKIRKNSSEENKYEDVDTAHQLHPKLNLEIDTIVATTITSKINDNIKGYSTENEVTKKEELKRYFVDMLTVKSLFNNNLSEAQYSSTITKAQSGLNGKGAVVVGNALPLALVGLITATAKGARFAINSTMLDSGNDLNHTNQTKLFTYRQIFNKTLTAAKERNEKITKSGGDSSLFIDNLEQYAINRTIEVHNQIESDKNILDREKEALHELGLALVNANKCNRKNENGISKQWSSLIFTFIGNTARILGTAAIFAAPFTGGLSLVVGGIGAAALGTGWLGLALLAASLNNQRQANAIHLSKWHRGSAQYKTSALSAQSSRDNLAHLVTVDPFIEISKISEANVALQKGKNLTPEERRIETKTKEIQTSKEKIFDELINERNDIKKYTPVSTKNKFLNLTGSEFLQRNFADNVDYKSTIIINEVQRQLDFNILINKSPNLNLLELKEHYDVGEQFRRDNNNEINNEVEKLVKQYNEKLDQASVLTNPSVSEPTNTTTITKENKEILDFVFSKSKEKVDKIKLEFRNKNSFKKLFNFMIAPLKKSISYEAKENSLIQDVDQIIDKTVGNLTKYQKTGKVPELEEKVILTLDSTATNKMKKDELRENQLAESIIKNVKSVIDEKSEFLNEALINNRLLTPVEVTSDVFEDAIDVDFANRETPQTFLSRIWSYFAPNVAPEKPIVAQPTPTSGVSEITTAEQPAPNQPIAGGVVVGTLATLAAPAGTNSNQEGQQPSALELRRQKRADSAARVDTIVRARKEAASGQGGSGPSTSRSVPRGQRP